MAKGKTLSQPELAAIRQRVAVNPDADQVCRDRAALLAYADELWNAIAELATNTYRMNRNLREQIASLWPLIETLATMKISPHGTPLYDDNQQLVQLIDARRQARSLVAQRQQKAPEEPESEARK